ncbi:MAG: F420-0--gamma-glutamyl ligase [Clostridiaceae bacterium]|nr:F420-0--gamma-glutamyl ligase [Clostridiaceae bacterium]
MIGRQGGKLVMRTVGTVARGIRAPIIKPGDDIINIVVESVLASAREDGFELKDRDVIGITESLVARAQGNYATLQDIALDVKRKYEGDIAVLFPLLSRNRFLMILKAIAMSERKIHLVLNYPSDEVGNQLVCEDKMDELGIDPCTDILDEKKYRKLFGEEVLHPFTGIDYVKVYKEVAVNNNIEIYLANNPKVALNFSSEILVANIHERRRTKKILQKAGAKTVYGLDKILNEPVNGSGFNPEYGLLGSNKATENKVKLFPRNCFEITRSIQDAIRSRTGKNVEVLVYGDGAFKDPVGKIWELADPVVSPGYTDGLKGVPSELKLKFIVDSEMEGNNGKGEWEIDEIVREKIKEKEGNLVGKNESLGTTPRQLTDLLGSLCDLISGSGDKGTPIVLIQGYFDNYATD